jgi:tellurite resistance protein
VETASVREREIDGITIAARDFETLRFAPLWVFYAVAGADDKVDKKELRALAEMLNNSQFFTDRFVREIFGSLARNFAEIMPAFMADERLPEKAFEDVRRSRDRIGYPTP